MSNFKNAFVQLFERLYYASTNVAILKGWNQVPKKINDKS